jgi:hypothetical protein
MRTSLRRVGAVFLFLLWGQVATANALPCSVSCLRELEAAHHHHDMVMGDEGHAVGHHAAGAKISAPENCGTPQLLVAAAVVPDFPTPPAIEVAVESVHWVFPASAASAVPEFNTPPPRA